MFTLAAHVNKEAINDISTDQSIGDPIQIPIPIPQTKWPRILLTTCNLSTHSFSQLVIEFSRSSNRFSATISKILSSNSRVLVDSGFWIDSSFDIHFFPTRLRISKKLGSIFGNDIQDSKLELTGLKFAFKVRSVLQRYHRKSKDQDHCPRMTEHHLRDEMKSLLGSHVGPEKTEHLEETKEEIENKVKRILKLFKDEGEERNLNIESQLVDLVMEYYKKYESLNEHHGDHTAELKEIFHFQGGTSSSQYSDSDPSSKEKANKASGSSKQQIEAACEKGRKFFEDLLAREDHLKNENSTLDEEEQRLVQFLQLELASLQTQTKELEVQFEEQHLNLLLVQTELQDKNLELERISKEKEDNQRKGKQEAEERKSQSMKKNIDLAGKVASLQKKLKKSIKEHKQLQDQTQETYLTKLGLKDEMFDSCIELSKQMKEEAELRNEAIIILQDEIKLTEAKLRLSNNKLQVTEQLLAEKKEVYRKEEEKFQQECKELKEQNSKLSSGINTTQRDLAKIRSSLEKTRNSFSGLEVVFQELQENDSSFHSRIVEVSEAQSTVKNWLMDTNGKIEELEKRLNVKEDKAFKIDEEKK